MKRGKAPSRRQHGQWLLSSLAIASGVFSLRFLGVFQGLEWAAWDELVHRRPAEPTDRRVVIVSIGESDLQKLGSAQLSDQVVAQLLERIKAQKPRVIGLDLYRNLPVRPGTATLQQVFATTPNLVGITKVVGDRAVSVVPGNPVLARAGRIAASDLVVDRDGRVRRGVLFPKVQADGSVAIESLGLRLALDYLAAAGIQPDANAPILRLGEVTFEELHANDGGYVGADTRGYQILLNLRNGVEPFERVSAWEVLSGQVPPNLMQDRLVVVGSMATGDADVFFTSLSHGESPLPRPMFGVELHAALASQVMSAVLDGRSLLRPLPKEMEFGLLVLVAYGSGSYYRRVASGRWRLLGLGCGLGGVGLGSYAALVWGGWWLPLVPLLAAMGLAVGGVFLTDAQRLRQLSTQDELTRLANRRAFNQVLEREWRRAVRSQTSLSLIICDVDYFKLYNDTYGHPQGDECLRQVAQALRGALKRPADLAARYGGEEFVILLPQTDQEGAMQVAETVRSYVRSLQLAHRSSHVSDSVTLSLGVSSTVPLAHMPATALINVADRALYEAKQQGRNRSVLKLPTLTD
jgi:adenylate cyclase